MSVLSHKCPCCSASLAYDGNLGKLHCASCGNDYDTSVIESLNTAPAQDETTIQFDMSKETYHPGEVATYNCQSCGSELVTDATTSATECAYCGSPIVLADQFTDSTRPESVLPFTVSKEEATTLFNDYFKKKLLLPSIFTNTKNKIATLRKLYVPYWLFDCKANADITYGAKKVDIRREGDYEVKTTRYYHIRRAGEIDFQNIPVDASVKLPNEISESVEPYSYDKFVSFAPSVLAGALADKADVHQDEAQQRAIKRMEESTKEEFERTVVGYTDVQIKGYHIQSSNSKATSVLLPIWLLTTDKMEKNGKKTYTFAINGQTGKLTCDIKPSFSKSLLCFLGIFGGTTALGYGILVILNLLGVL